MQAHVVNVVEPTLVSEAGHCSTVVHGLCSAGKGLSFRVWAGAGAKLPTLERVGVDIRRYFFRRLRKLQAFLLYRRLLREPGQIVVSTAGRFDLTVLDWVASGPIPESKVFLYFHRLRLTPAKEAALRRLAARQPHVVMLGTTDTIERKLHELGFARTATMLPLPVPADSATEQAQPFRHVLVAGASRRDKGFRQIVDFLEHLAQSGASIPVTIQVSGDHYNRYDEHTLQDLKRLRALNYGHLTLVPETLRSDEYLALFQGAICLQPYDRHEYADKISGITLDAFTSGAPVIAISDTWMARMVERFGAGVTVTDTTPRLLEQAVSKVIAAYDRYHERARAAGVALREQQTWKPVVEAIRRSVDGK